MRTKPFKKIGLCHVCGKKLPVLDYFKFYRGKWNKWRSKILFWRRKIYGICLGCFIKTHIKFILYKRDVNDLLKPRNKLEGRE